MEHGFEPAAAVEGDQVRVAPDGYAADEDLWHRGEPSGELDELVSRRLISRDVDALERDPSRGEESLGLAAVGAVVGGVDENVLHDPRGREGERNAVWDDSIEKTTAPSQDALEAAIIMPACGR